MFLEGFATPASLAHAAGYFFNGPLSLDGFQVGLVRIDAVESRERDCLFGVEAATILPPSLAEVLCMARLVNVVRRRSSTLVSAQN